MGDVVAAAVTVNDGHAGTKRDETLFAHDDGGAARVERRHGSAGAREGEGAMVAGGVDLGGGKLAAGGHEGGRGSVANEERLVPLW